MTKPKPTIRAQIEAILRAATEPMSAHAISAASGATLSQVRSSISIFRGGQVDNVGTIPAPLYMWVRPVERVSVSRFSGHYDGRELRPFDGRPRALEAFDKGSVVAGVWHPRARPAIIGARTLEAIGGRGK